MAANPHPQSEEVLLTPPSDFDAEQAVLGSIFLEPDTAASIAFSIVNPSDFYRVYHQAIARAMKTCLERREPVDIVTVSAELRRTGKLDEVGSGEYLTALIGEVPTAAHVARYANIVAEKSLLRHVAKIGSDLQREAMGNPADVGAFVAKWADPLKAISERIKPPEAPPLRTLDEVLATAGSLTWTWPGWLPNGYLSILFGPPEAGKSYVGLEFARCLTTGSAWPDAAQTDQAAETALLLDFEGTEATTAERARACGVPDGRVFLQPQETIPYLTEPRSVDLIRGWLAETQARMLIIDSWRDATPGVDENDSAGTAAAIRPLCLLARDFDIPVLLLHHARKQQATTGKDRWELDQGDLRGSTALAAAARTIIGIDKPDAGRHIRRLKVVKSNFGARPEPLGFLVTDNGLQWTDAPFVGREMPQHNAAAEAIRIVLQREPLRYSELAVRLKVDHGISETTARRALKEVATKGLDGRWGLPA